MNRTNRLLLCLGAILCLAPAIPDRTVLVKNNSAITLACIVKPSNRAWTPLFALPRGAQWSEKAPSADPYLIRCRPPVVQTTYRLVPGQRYSLLRSPGGSVALLKVSPDD